MIAREDYQDSEISRNPSLIWISSVLVCYIHLPITLCSTVLGRKQRSVIVTRKYGFGSKEHPCSRGLRAAHVARADNAEVSTI
jgi:hypothetical protein